MSCCGGEGVNKKSFKYRDQFTLSCYAQHPYEVGIGEGIPARSLVTWTDESKARIKAWTKKDEEVVGMIKGCAVEPSVEPGGRFIVVNGVFNEDLVHIPDGVTLEEMKEAAHPHIRFDSVHQ